MGIVFNPFTKKFDYVQDITTLDGLYLKLDQTTPQTILNDVFILDALKSTPFIGTDGNGKLCLATTNKPLSSELVVGGGGSSWQISLLCNWGQFELIDGYGYTNILSIKDIFLKLDQSGGAQTVDGGTPIFDEGITANATGDTAITANKDIVLKAGQKLIFDGA